MSAPALSFIYNTTSSGLPYTGTGEDKDGWKVLHLNTASGILPDKFVFTGGGIEESLPTPTAPYGSRSATIKPAVNTFIIPQTYVESHIDNTMYNIPDCGKNSNRYCFGVYIDGYIASDLYMEAWSDSNFNSTDVTVLTGTPLYANSMINAISTTNVKPPTTWSGGTWNNPTYSGASTYLRGYDNRVKLKGADSAQDESLYYNIYIELPHDAPFFHNMPVLSFRYLYI